MFLFTCLNNNKQGSFSFRPLPCFFIPGDPALVRYYPLLAFPYNSFLKHKTVFCSYLYAVSCLKLCRISVNVFVWVSVYIIFSNQILKYRRKTLPNHLGADIVKCVKKRIHQSFATWKLVLRTSIDGDQLLVNKQFSSNSIFSFPVIRTDKIIESLRHGIV